MTQAYPLQWPAGWPRSAGARIDGAQFVRNDGYGRKRVTMAQASADILGELRLLGAAGVVISSNVMLRQDGLPRSGQRAPDDPGVAVYFSVQGRQMAMARDAYTRPEDNLRSLTLAISGLRQMQRHGGGTMLGRAFEGFAALPAPGAARQWHEVLGCPPDASVATIQRLYKIVARVAAEAGDEARLVEINVARDAGVREAAR